MKKVSSMIISFVMVFFILTGCIFVLPQCTLPAFAIAADEEDDMPSYIEGIYGDFKYWIVSYSESPDKDYIEISSYTGNKSDVVIPDNINNYIVKGISECAFSGNKNIKKMTLPDTILYMGYSAFDGCSGLNEIRLSEKIGSIEELSFRNCSNLEKIIIPEGVRLIENSSFTSCTKLKIYGKEGSYSETYAKRNNIPFISYVWADKVTLNKSSMSLTEGSTGTLTAVITPSDASEKSLSWTTSKSSVATVSDGTVTAVGVGEAVITVSTVDGKKASCNVTVKSLLTPSLDGTTLSARSVLSGQSITITCSASGGKSPYQYAVYYRLGTGSWYTLQSYKTNSKVKFTPSKKGEYQISVKVKDANGTVVKKYYSVSVFSNKYTLANSSFLSSESIELGDSVKITAKGLGGTNFYQYAVYVRKTGVEKWTTVSNYKSDNIVYYKPSSEGTYEFSVKVKDSSGKSAKKTLMLIVDPPSTKLKNKSVISNTNVFSGDAVCIDAEASGGTGYYIYGCYVKKSDENEWKVVRSFSSESHFVFTVYESGVYQVCIRVKDSGGTTSKKYFDINADLNNAGIKNRSTVSSDNIRFGDSVTMKGIAEGGTKYYEYAMYYRLPEDEDWSIIQNFGVNSEVKFTPDVAGQYELCINAADADGVNDKKYFSLKVVQ